MSSLTVRYIRSSEPHTGSFNMAADDVLARGVVGSGYHSILRMYSFDPPTVSLGRNQAVSEVDITACERKGWDVVRRSTGGRSLLHLNDICYSIIVPIESDVFKELRRLYQGVAISLTSVLNSYGIPASAMELPVKHSFNLKLKKSRLCISAQVRGEVHVKGRKITSASQRIYRDSILQHGSIFLRGEPTVIADIVPTDLVQGIDFGARLKERVITIEEAQTQPISSEDFIKAFTSQLCQYFGFNLANKPIKISELEEITALQNNFTLSPLKQEFSAA